MYKSRKNRKICNYVTPSKLIHLQECSFWYKDLDYITTEMKITYNKLPIKKASNPSAFLNPKYEKIGIETTIVHLKNGKQLILKTHKQNVIWNIERQLKKGRLDDTRT